jgi:hypothetical protein
MRINMSNELPEVAHPDLDNLTEGRWKDIREHARYVEAGGPGRSNDSAENVVLEESLKKFTPEERTGFMEMRNIDLQRIFEDLKEASVKVEGRTKEYSNEELETIRIEWDENGFRLISLQADEEGNVSETSDPDEISKHHDMLSLISVYREAQESMEKELMAHSGE